MTSLENGKLLLDKDDIYSYLKNREPFLFVDSVTVRPGKSSFMTKKLSEDEWFFPCHFPGNPMMPGVIQLEMMFQTSAFAIKLLEGNKEKTTNIAQISSVKFKRHVRPGETIDVITSVERFRRGIANIKGKIMCENQLCCEADFLLVVLDDVPVMEE